jgi:hypothetical protein
MNVDAPDWRSGFDRHFTTGRLALLLGALMLISYPEIVLGTHAFFYRDAGLLGYPVAFYFRDCFWHGHCPLWNPYSDCGTPFLAQWHTLALYPLSLIYLLLPMPWSMNVFLLAHVFLAGIGMSQLARRWFGSRFAGAIAGLAFAWNGLTLQCLMWPALNAALAWMPWVILQCERAQREGGRALVWAALLGACQMLSGAPEIIFFTWLIVAANFGREAIRRAERRDAPTESQNHITASQRSALPVRARGGLRLLALVALIAALSAVQLLPWLELLAHGNRTSATGGNAWALPAWGAANFLVPLFRSVNSLSGVFMPAGQDVISSYYVGVLPLLLAALAVWRRRDGPTMLLGIIALLGVLLAMGNTGVLLGALRRVFPLLGFSRYPVKFITLTVFSLALLSGAGAAWLQCQPSSVVRRCVTVLGALLGVCILAILADAFWSPTPGTFWSDVWPNALGRWLFLAAGAGLLAAMFGPRAALARFLFLLLMGMDICTHVPRQNPTVAAAAYGDYTPPMTRLPRLGESRAMLSPWAQDTMDHLVHPDPLHFYLGQRAELYGNCNLLDAVPKVNGFFPMRPAWSQKIQELLMTTKSPTNLMVFLGVSQVTSDGRLFVWEARTNFMPFATAGQKPVFLDDAAALAALDGPEFLPREVVFLPSGARGKIQAEVDAGARVLSSRVSASECVFETTANRRTMLVVAQTYYPCWKAAVDGNAAEVWRANYGFQAVEVPAGHHVVRLAYKDRAFKAGAGISLAALLACAALLCNQLIFPARSGNV